MYENINTVYAAYKQVNDSCKNIKIYHKCAEEQ